MTGRQGFAAVLLGVLVLTAGCNVLDGGREGRYDVPSRTVEGPSTPDADLDEQRTTTGTGPDEDRIRSSRTTVRPVEPSNGTPDGRIVLGREAIAPGVTAARVRDPERLADAHLAVLFEQSFRVHLNHTVRYANGSRRSIDTEAALTGNRSQYTIDRTLNSTDGDRSWVQVRSTGYDVYLGVAGNGPGQQVTYDEPGADDVPARNCTPVSLPDPTFHGTVERAFEATGTTAVRESEDAPDRYRITATGVDAGRIDPAATDVRNLSVGAVVDASGVVRYLQVSYRARLNDTPVHVTTTLRVSGVGETVVPPQPLRGPNVVQVPTGGPGQCS